MIKEWFTNYTNGSEILDKDVIINYITHIETEKPLDETNSL